MRIYLCLRYAHLPIFLIDISADSSPTKLVVVGDQSSGKSSLLEALTRLPFPVAGTLCTRFATQIVFRRSAPGEADKIKVTIIPSEHGGDERKISLREFTRHFDTLEADDFSEVLRDVCLSHKLTFKPNTDTNYRLVMQWDYHRVE